MRRISSLLKKCFNRVVIPAYAGMKRRKIFFLVRVEGESGWPVLVPGGRYFASGFLSPRIGDFAVFRNQQDTERVFVKRVVGLANGFYRMESAVSWGSSSDDFGLVPRELILGKIILRGRAS